MTNLICMVHKKMIWLEDDLVLQLGEVDVLTRNGLNLDLCSTENKHLIPSTKNWQLQSGQMSTPFMPSKFYSLVHK